VTEKAYLGQDLFRIFGWLRAKIVNNMTVVVFFFGSSGVGDHRRKLGHCALGRHVVLSREFDSGEREGLLQDVKLPFLIPLIQSLWGSYVTLGRVIAANQFMPVLCCQILDNARTAYHFESGSLLPIASSSEVVLL
jgi:hypothetical protein